MIGRLVPAFCPVPVRYQTGLLALFLLCLPSWFRIGPFGVLPTANLRVEARRVCKIRSAFPRLMGCKPLFPDPRFAQREKFPAPVRGVGDCMDFACTYTVPDSMRVESRVLYTLAMPSDCNTRYSALCPDAPGRPMRVRFLQSVWIHRSCARDTRRYNQCPIGLENAPLPA